MFLKRNVIFHMVRTRVMLLFLAMIICMMTFFSFFNSRIGQIVYEKVNIANTDLLAYYGRDIEQRFETIESFFVSQRLQMTLYLDIEKTDSLIDNYLASCQIGELFSNPPYGDDVLDYVFLYAPESKTCIDYAYRDDMCRNEMRNWICSQADTNRLKSDSWTAMQLDDRFYIYYIVKIHHSYLGGVIDCEKLIDTMTAGRAVIDGQVFILDANLHILDTNFAEQTDMLCELEAGETYEAKIDNDWYRVNILPIDQGTFYLAHAMNKQYLSGQLLENAGMFYLAAAVLLLLAIIGILLLWKSFVNPLSRIVQGMHALKAGDFTYRIQHPCSGEFAEITETFNDMSGEIWKLKIDIYEEQIQRQKTQLMFLQNQLNPHFLINCLNSLRSLELSENHARYEEMSTKIGKYMRASLSTQGMISLGAEQDNTRNYVEIQKLRYEDRFDVEFNICEELLENMVPTQLLQCFVENSIKYQLHQDQKLHITVSGDFADESCERAELFICDNGTGFDNDILETLNHGEKVRKGERSCIGIYNTMQRLKIIYGKQAELVFFNDRDGGACVKIEFPVE